MSALRRPPQSLRSRLCLLIGVTSGVRVITDGTAIDMSGAEAAGYVRHMSTRFGTRAYGPMNDTAGIGCLDTGRAVNLIGADLGGRLENLVGADLRVRPFRPTHRSAIHRRCSSSNVEKSFLLF